MSPGLIGEQMGGILPGLAQPLITVEELGRGSLLFLALGLDSCHPGPVDWVYIACIAEVPGGIELPCWYL